MNITSNICAELKTETMVLIAQQLQSDSTENLQMLLPDYKEQKKADVNDLTISIEKVISKPQSSVQTVEKNKVISTNELKTLLEQIIRSKGEMDSCNMSWANDKTVVMENLSGLALHNFLLKIEELGKNVTFTKKTVIEIH